MTEFKKAKKPRFIFSAFFLVVSLGIGVFFMVGACSSESNPVLSNIILESSEGDFLYSNLSSTIVQSKIDQGESPAAVANLELYIDGEDLYLHPNSMSSLVKVFSNEVNKHPFKEASYDGYLSERDGVSYKVETKFKGSETIGKQVMIYSVELKNSKGETKMIEWKYDPESGEAIPIRNCQNHSFWIQTRPSPGETVYSTRDFLVVKLKDIANFFKRNYHYDEETKVLFVNR